MKVNGKTIIMLIIILLVLSGISYTMDSEVVSGRVLMISAYSPGYETFYGQVDGIRSVFDEHNIQFDLEFMDTKRFYEEENVNKFHDYLKFKLERLDQYDVILAADDNALNFVIENKEELFPTQTIVFLGINNVDLGIELGYRSDVTGVLEEPTIRETIDLAMTLRPEANNVIFITDQTTTALSVKDRYYREAYHFPELEFSEFELGENSFDEMDEFLSHVTNNDIVLLSSALRDKNNTSITFKVSLDRIIENTPQPVFHLYEFGLGDGILGGHLVRYFSQGEEAANIAVRILSGENPDDISLVENANRVMLDYDILQKHGIDESLAPEETIWINRELSVFEEYFWYILLAFAILVIQGLFIMALQLNIRKRKVVEKELLESKEKVQTSNEELSATNEELRATNEELAASFEEIEGQRERIYNLIYIDPLTELKNRHGITEELTELIADDSVCEKVAVMFLDVDNFKDINDTFGHDVGDEAIRETGNRLKELQSDLVRIGRFGGDEFLIFIKCPDENYTLDNVIAKIRSCFSELIQIGDKSFFLTVSMGISIYPNHAITKKDLIKKADMALYEAKFSGKNKFVVYERHMDKALEDKVLFQTLVREGFENDEFYMNYQPYYDAKSKKITGYEALIRWNNPTLGMVSPYHLITTAEEMGLILEIGEWIFKEACKFSKKVNDISDDDVLVSVNISAVQIVKVDFYSRAVEIVEEIGVNPELICLEMTETVLIESFESTRKQIDQLKKYGFKLALDDFGTGYSSLSYFKNLPAEILKIDKSFVDHMASDSYDEYTVEAIIKLAHFNGLKVTAEGVEEGDQVDILNRMSCDVIQGYFYSKPLSEADALKMIE